MSLDSIPQRPVTLPYKKNPNSLESRIYALFNQIPGLDPSSPHVEKIDQQSIYSVKQIIQENLNEKKKIEKDLGIYQTLITNWKTAHEKGERYFIFDLEVKGLENGWWNDREHNIETIRIKMPVHYDAIQKFVRDMSTKGWNMKISTQSGAYTRYEGYDGNVTHDKNHVIISFNW